MGLFAAMREAVREGKSRNGALKMSKATLIATLMAVVSAFSSPAKAQAPPKLKPSVEPMYLITAHTVGVSKSTHLDVDFYTITYGSLVLKLEFDKSVYFFQCKPNAPSWGADSGV